MDRTAALLTTVQTLYDTALEPDAERHWLDAVRGLVGAEHCNLTHDARDFSWWTCSQLEGSQLLTTSPAQIREGHLFACHNLPAARASSVDAPLTPEWNEFYQRYLRPIAGGLAASMVWHSQGGSYLLHACRDLHRGRLFSADELGLLQHLLPHLRTATRLRERLGALQGKADSLDATLQELPTAILLVDCQARLLYCNAAASLLLQARDGLRVSAGRLRIRHDDSDVRWLQGLRATPSPGTSSGAASPAFRLAVPRHPRRPLMLTVAPGAMLQGLDGSHETWTVMAVDPERERISSVELLASVYGLTPRESDVVRLIADGLTLEHAAHLLGIGVGTARQYLKSIFHKTGTRRQSDLLRLVLLSAH